MPSWPQQLWWELSQQILALGIFLGRVSHYAATPVTVALCLGHSNITRFRPWSPIAPDRKSFEPHRKNSKSCSDDWHHWRFWSVFRHFGTHFTESFCMSKSSWMMNPTHSCEMPSCSVIDLAKIRLSSRLAREFDQQSQGWSLFWVVQDKAHHRWKNHHV